MSCNRHTVLRSVKRDLHSYSSWLLGRASSPWVTVAAGKKCCSVLWVYLAGFLSTATHRLTTGTCLYITTVKRNQSLTVNYTKIFTTIILSFVFNKNNMGTLRVKVRLRQVIAVKVLFTSLDSSAVLRRGKACNMLVVSRYSKDGKTQITGKNNNECSWNSCTVSRCL